MGKRIVIVVNFLKESKIHESYKINDDELIQLFPSLPMSSQTTVFVFLLRVMNVPVKVFLHAYNIASKEDT